MMDLAQAQGVAITAIPMVPRVRSAIVAPTPSRFLHEASRHEAAMVKSPKPQPANVVLIRATPIDPSQRDQDLLSEVTRSLSVMAAKRAGTAASVWADHVILRLDDIAEHLAVWMAEDIAAPSWTELRDTYDAIATLSAELRQKIAGLRGLGQARFLSRLLEDEPDRGIITGGWVPAPKDYRHEAARILGSADDAGSASNHPLSYIERAAVRARNAYEADVSDRGQGNAETKVWGPPAQRMATECAKLLWDLGGETEVTLTRVLPVVVAIWTYTTGNDETGIALRDYAARAADAVKAVKRLEDARLLFQDTLSALLPDGPEDAVAEILRAQRETRDEAAVHKVRPVMRNRSRKSPK